MWSESSAVHDVDLVVTSCGRFFLNYLFNSLHAFTIFCRLYARFYLSLCPLFSDTFFIVHRTTLPHHSSNAYTNWWWLRMEPSTHDQWATCHDGCDYELGSCGLCLWQKLITYTKHLVTSLFSRRQRILSCRLFVCNFQLLTLTVFENFTQSYRWWLAARLQLEDHFHIISTSWPRPGVVCTRAEQWTFR